MEIIDGRKIADAILNRIGDVSAYKLKLAIVFIGDDRATKSFVEQKKKVANKLGIEIILANIQNDAPTKEVVKVIQELSNDSGVTGIVVQLPLPNHIETGEVLSAIVPTKDVDALYGNIFIAPAVLVVLEIINYLNQDIANLNFSVVGQGRLIGRPIFDFFKNKTKSMQVLRRGDDIKNMIFASDVIISGAGDAGIITPDMIKENAIVIDFGCGLDKDGKIRGDFNAVDSNKNFFYTPTPYGTGPILVAKLFENIVSVLNIKK